MSTCLLSISVSVPGYEYSKYKEQNDEKMVDKYGGKRKEVSILGLMCHWLIKTENSPTRSALYPIIISGVINKLFSLSVGF
uniref:Uncharacterized protein n=1 Tax=Rhizophora mucronata TaxID=61149 RepID=A0A2P2J7C6_RHIMU